MGSTGNKPETYQQLRRRWHDDYGITPDWDSDTKTGSLANLTAKQKQMLESEIKRFIAVFPEVTGMNISIDMKDKISHEGRDAAAAYYGDVSEMSITDKLFDKNGYSRNLEEKWYAGVLTTFHPKGTTSTSAVSHELGHALVNYIARVTTPTNGGYVAYLKATDDKIKELNKSITENAANSLQSTYIQLSSRVSHYSTYSRGEAVAEAVSDYVANGSKANPYSKAIVAELKRELGSIRGGGK